MQPEHVSIVTVIQAIGTLVSLGIAGWAKWSIHQVAREAAREETGMVGKRLNDHDADPRAHRALVEAWEASRERALAKTMDVVAGTLKAALVDALVTHNRDPWAHPEGSENRIGPLRASIDRLHETIGALDKRLAGLDGFVAEVREMKRRYDEAQGHGDTLPRHSGRG